jgi:hypothetical protein
VAVENEDWNSKLNFFLILKGLVLHENKKAREQILSMFGNLLILALP